MTIVQLTTGEVRSDKPLTLSERIQIDWLFGVVADAFKIKEDTMTKKVILECDVCGVSYEPSSARSSNPVFSEFVLKTPPTPHSQGLGMTLSMGEYHFCKKCLFRVIEEFAALPTMAKEALITDSLASRILANKRFTIDDESED